MRKVFRKSAYLLVGDIIYGCIKNTSSTLSTFAYSSKILIHTYLLNIRKKSNNPIEKTETHTCSFFFPFSFFDYKFSSQKNEYGENTRAVPYFIDEFFLRHV